MERQHFTRRIVLSAVVVGLAILGTGVFQEGALAWSSKANFKSECEALGGVFVDSPGDGLTICLWQNGGRSVCDQSGGNCYYFDPPPKKQEEPGWAAPLDATSGATITDDTQPIAPVETPLQTIAGAPLEAVAETPLEPIAEAPLEAPMESQDVSAADSGTVAAPVEAPVTLTEEPMTAEASAEQP